MLNFYCDHRNIDSVDQLHKSLHEVRRYKNIYTKIGKYMFPSQFTTIFLILTYQTVVTNVHLLGLLSSYPFFTRTYTHVKVLALLRSLYLTNKIIKAC